MMANPGIDGHEGKIEALRTRLNGSAPPRKQKKQSIAHEVRALLPEIRMRRAAGWTWEQIAAAMYDDEAKASAVRTAFNRSAPKRGKKRAGANRASSGGSPSSSNGTPLPATPPFGQPLTEQGCAAPRGSLPNLFGQRNDPGFPSSSQPNA
ncbi:hypothetical protein [Sphingomonas edaphi]|uniref:Uncharacterized protein n=1 Tax=Sphingomonas edaphi TaxID=2315689 RepID=A0A418Q1W0_9SPHN|nr:hypothetical protein [Sphingomonas edaphi]RIX31847.1 hypothetical protein D3M59_02290 [Sphingomonas edaphi]